MSFADELRKKAMEYEPDNIRVKNIIERSVEVIKRECGYAAEHGQIGIDGFIYLYGDSEFIDKIPEDKRELNSKIGILFEGLKREEENRIIEEIRDKTKELCFAHCVITSWHPDRVFCGYEKVRSWLTGAYKQVPQYKYTNGFCIEVHIKW